ncbi:hypothetical protein C8Q78DRAFT_397909 [Trametes maxima]|nr:hypothetical protein C8Q78DRAFT_397909 [Trametes maxima]
MNDMMRLAVLWLATIPAGGCDIRRRLRDACTCVSTNRRHRGTGEVTATGICARAQGKSMAQTCGRRASRGGGE